jgi:AraC family transcriptional regulator, positive regulator of tynA and feaB
MLQRDDVGGPPRLNFEAWRDLLRSNCGGEVEVTAPKVFAGWMRPINACGLEAASVKIQWGSADLGSFAQRVERTHRDIRLDGADHYLVVFQVAGQSAMTQIDQPVQLDVGDVALVDAARPVKYLCRVRSPQWLTLRLPRKSVQSHLGFEPQGGVSRHNARAGRALFDLIRDADTESMDSPAHLYMQLAVYDLVGALFAPSDPRPISRGSDKLFARICGVISDGFSDPDFGPAEVAKETGVSLRYVQRLFTERGTTCSEFIYSQRLDRAAHLVHRGALLGTRQPISEIAFACGFRDYVHFARRFRRRFGHPPGAHAGHSHVNDDRTARAGTGESAPDIQFRTS